MRRAATLVFVLALAPVVVLAAQLRGTWHAKVEGERVHLDLLRDESRSGRSFPRTELQISDAELNATTETPVSFALARDAGSIAMRARSSPAKVSAVSRSRRTRRTGRPSVLSAWESTKS
jgi:hypothetical protein